MDEGIGVSVYGSLLRTAKPNTRRSVHAFGQQQQGVVLRELVGLREIPEGDVSGIKLPREGEARIG